MSTQHALRAGAQGADHVHLEGDSSGFRFRSERVAARKLGAEVTFQFGFEGAGFGPLPVLDLSTTGVGLRPLSMFMPQGAVLENATLTYHGQVVWAGTAAVVYQVEGASPRLGVRFVSSVLDLDRIHLRESVLHGGLGANIEALERERAALPAEYRAAIADLAQLLLSVQRAVTELAHDRARDNLGFPKERDVIQAVYEAFAPRYFERVRDLYEQSVGFTQPQRELSRQYASQMLAPLLTACPMHRRARDKPFGYAGDYALMCMFFMEQSPADTLYGRVLHYLFQRYTLARAVIARESCMRRSVQSVLARHLDRTRIVCLGCGPAIELAHAIEETERFDRPVELILMDQDEAALSHCYRDLSARLSIHPSGHMVKLHCLHFSVRQLLKPRNQAENRVVDEVLRNVDLVYSAGLFDYLPQLVAASLVRTLYGLLRPRGQLFIGNLRASADSTWVMENLLIWHLEYREREDMLRLASRLAPSPIGVDIVEDATGHCLFLDVHKPAVVG